MKISRSILRKINRLSLMVYLGLNRKKAKKDLAAIMEMISAEQTEKKSETNIKKYVVGTVTKTISTTSKDDTKETLTNTTKDIITDEDGNVTEKIIKIVKEEKWLDGLTSRLSVTENNKIIIDYNSEDLVNKTKTSLDSEYSTDGHTGKSVEVILDYAKNSKTTITTTTKPDKDAEIGHVDIVNKVSVILEVDAYAKKIAIIPKVDDEDDEDLTEQVSVDPSLINQLSAVDDFLDEKTASDASDEIILSKINSIAEDTTNKDNTSKISKMAGTVNKSGSTVTFQGLQIFKNMLQMVSAEDDDIIDARNYPIYWFTRMDVRLINGHLIIKT